MIENGNRERQASFTITEEYENYTIHRYLKEVLHLSEHIIRRMKYRNGGARVNHGIAFMNVRLHAGETLTIPLPTPGDYDRTGESVWMKPPETMPPLEILYEDDDLIFLNKRDHVVCHPSPGHYADTLANQVAEHLGLHRGKIYPVGRLDRDTSGIVLFAKNADAAGIMTLERSGGEYRKLYRAWVEGIIEEDSFTVDQPLGRKPGSLMLRQPDPEGQPAVTHATVRKRDLENQRTLVYISIENGRTHQIRVHMASIGHPVCGDILYNKRCRKAMETKEGEPPEEKRTPADRTEAEPLRLEAFRVKWLRPYFRTPEELSLETEFREF